jgi:molybdenum-dependent DNA-binding transcriptional regulator ModE
MGLFGFLSRKKEVSKETEGKRTGRTSRTTPGTRIVRKQMPLGQCLTKKGLISSDELENALRIQKERRVKAKSGVVTDSYLGSILMELGYVKELDLVRFL